MPLTTISLSRPLTSYIKIQKYIITPLVRNRSFFLKQSQLSQQNYLNLGCNIFTHKNFINLDYEWNQNIDICWDLNRGIPLEDKSMQGIFSEHCLEHFSIEKLDFVLSECYRVLKPGGVLRFIVPDFEYFVTHYFALSQDKSPQPLSSEFCEDQANYQGIYTTTIAINKLFYSWGHQFIFDFHTIKKLLEKSNFIKIKKETFRIGQLPELLIDSEHRQVGSLYVEALKY